MLLDRHHRQDQERVDLPFTARAVGGGDKARGGVLRHAVALGDELRHGALLAHRGAAEADLDGAGGDSGGDGLGLLAPGLRPGGEFAHQDFARRRQGDGQQHGQADQGKQGARRIKEAQESGQAGDIHRKVRCSHFFQPPYLVGWIVAFSDQSQPSR